MRALLLVAVTALEFNARAPAPVRADGLRTRPSMLERSDGAGTTVSEAGQVAMLQRFFRMPAWRRVSGDITSCPQEGKRVVYLTFDDGPSEEIQEFSEALTALGVHATFFWVAAGVKPEHQAALSGHAAGSHTMHHADLTGIQAAATLGENLTDHKVDLDTEIGEAHKRMQDALYDGERGPVLFRPPFGFQDVRSREYQQEHGLAYTAALWDIDTHDWSGKSAARVKKDLQDDWGPDGDTQGHVILMHEGNTPDWIANTLDIVRFIKEELCKGCSFEDLEHCPKVRDVAGWSSEPSQPE